MTAINPYKYTEATSVRDVIIDNDVIRLTTCFLIPNKPVALSLFSGSVPISYVRVMSDPIFSSTIADGKFYGRAVISGVPLAYGLDDTPTVCCAKSGKILFRFPIQKNETPFGKNAPKMVSVSDLILELDSCKLSSIEDLLPYAVQFYLKKGKSLFIDNTYQMLLRRRPEPGLSQRKVIDENNLSEALLHFMKETYESDEAQQYYIRRIPGPMSDDFLFRA